MKNFSDSGSWRRSFAHGVTGSAAWTSVLVFFASGLVGLEGSAGPSPILPVWLLLIPLMYVVALSVFARGWEWTWEPIDDERVLVVVPFQPLSAVVVLGASSLVGARIASLPAGAPLLVLAVAPLVVELAARSWPDGLRRGVRESTLLSLQSVLLAFAAICLIWPSLDASQVVWGVALGCTALAAGAPHGLPWLGVLFLAKALVYGWL